MCYINFSGSQPMSLGQCGIGLREAGRESTPQSQQILIDINIEIFMYDFIHVYIFSSIILFVGMFIFYSCIFGEWTSELFLHGLWSTQLTKKS